jgi:glyoxylase-like metal-dependent hydrolase (beta-lactamase superfamily II)
MMPLEIIPMVLGAIENNTYLIADTESGLAAVVDPSFDIQPTADEILRRGWTLDAIWLTHAHFDHIAGVSSLLAALDSAAPVALHSADLPLYHNGGGASIFGFSLGPLPEPTVLLKHDQTISLGDHHLRVLHTPGHTPGHVVLYSSEEKSLFCGDLIFFLVIGRTDLPGGNYAHLEASIRSQVYVLPPETRLLSGHGAETTVGDEKKNNPFVSA